MLNVNVVRHEVLDSYSADCLHRLRHRVFFEKLNWEVPSFEGKEIDQFDVSGTVHVISRDATNDVTGCIRLMPTMGSYMLKDIFPELLNGQTAVQDPRVWEMSRFAVSTREQETSGFGFGEIAKALIRSACDFAAQEGIDRYVFVTSVAVERLLHTLGVHIHRIAPPRQIGVVRTVACVLECDEQTHSVLYRRAH